MIESIHDLQSLVMQGFTDWEQFGNVRAVYKDGMVLFNYTHAAQYEGRWNWFERVSRGLIMDAATGEVIARPFDKFWNWGEGGRKATWEHHIVTVTEKIDGSLGILYRDNGMHKIATRGSFDSEQAVWATNHLTGYYDMCRLPPEFTLLFEIVYPENRIVVDYGDDEDLFLLAIRNRFTGEYLPFYPDVYEWAEFFGFPTPRVCSFNNVTDIIAATDNLPITEEGWVVEFSNGQRFKFKGDRYLEIHRIISVASFKRVLDSVANGTFEEMIAVVPDELLDEIRGWKGEIDDVVAHKKAVIESVFSKAPKHDRKTFALWVKDNRPELAPYLFRRLDGQDYTNLIYKLAFRERGGE